MSLIYLVWKVIKDALLQTCIMAKADCCVNKMQHSVGWKNVKPLSEQIKKLESYEILWDRAVKKSNNKRLVRMYLTHFVIRDIIFVFIILQMNYHKIYKMIKDVHSIMKDVHSRCSTLTRSRLRSWPSCNLCFGWWQYWWFTTCWWRLLLPRHRFTATSTLKFNGKRKKINEILKLAWIVGTKL